MASAQKKTNDAAMNELPLVLSHLNISSDTTPKHLKIPLIQSLKSLDRLPAQSVHGSSLSPSLTVFSTGLADYITTAQEPEEAYEWEQQKAANTW
ncbi:MAG: hypothetical protein M1820_005928 [Bogoriella megaspora]|nr:MAG: hypothetical protein M1820_005928 [Bogoriella megaspora]